MTIKEFEDRYLGKLVRVRFKSSWLEPTEEWIDEDEEFIGHLAATKNYDLYKPTRKNLYYLEEHIEKGILWSTVFNKNSFKSIKLIKEN